MRMLALPLLAMAAPALAQADVEARIRALEAQNSRQQALIEEQAAAIRELRRQVSVPETLPGDPVLPTDVFLAPPAGNVGSDGGQPDTGTDTGVGSTVASATRSVAPQGGIDTGALATSSPGVAPPTTGVDTLGEGVRRALEASRALALADVDRPRIAIVAGRPTILSSDGRYSLSLRGIVQVDTAFHDQDRGRPLALDFRRGSVGAGGRETLAATDLSNGTNFRRARLGAEGVFDRDWNYRLMFEFGGTGTEGPARINDAWIAYTGFAPFTVQVGAFSPPANMDDGLSPEDQIFLERASSAELSRALAGADGRFGVGLRAAGRNYFGAVTLTGATINDPETFDEQFGVVSRFAFLPFTEQDDNTYNVQIGASGTYVFNTADQGASTALRSPSRFRDRPELRVDSTRLVDTGVIDADDVSVYGLEFGAQVRNFFVQAEHFWFDVKRRNAAFTDPGFSGGYVEGSWILTGEYRRHNMATGSFQNPRPYATFSPRNGGFGAFELAARWSVLDLDENAGAAGTAAVPGAIRGGEQSILTAGLNWYPNSNVKFLFNYQRVDIDRLNPAGPGNLLPFSPAPATPPVGAQIGQEYDVYSIRSQFAF